MKILRVIAVVLAIQMATSKPIPDPPTIEVGNPPNYEVSIIFKIYSLTHFISFYARGINHHF